MESIISPLICSTVLMAISFLKTMKKYYIYIYIFIYMFIDRDRERDLVRLVRGGGEERFYKSMVKRLRSDVVQIAVHGMILVIHCRRRRDSR